MQGNGVAAIGECMLELSARQGGDWRMGFAGDTFNTLWAMRALLPQDVAADYVSAFGDDPFSRDQIAFFRDHGIGIAASPVIPGARPGLYAITLTGAERSFTYWRADAAARRLADDPAALRGSLQGRRLAYFSGITLAILEPAARATLFAALKSVRAEGTTVAFDPNYRPRLWPSPEAAREAISAAVAVADIALPTFPDELALFGDATPSATAERLAKAGVGEIVVKDGEAPALVAAAGETTSVRRRRQLQRRLSRRAAFRRFTGRGGPPRPSRRRGGRPGTRRAGAVRDVERSLPLTARRQRNRYSVTCR
jgi:2-dehydro-3-deoxygluconokinase